jgi:hypothetical protein
VISTEKGELADSSDLFGEPRALRERMARDGYLFIRRLLPVDAVARVRGDVLAICRRHGWLRPGPDGDAGIVDLAASCAPAEPRYDTLYSEVISLQSYNELAHAEPVMRLAETLFQARDVIPRPAKRAHLIFPQDGGGATPPHQDYPHEQGTEDAYTTWIPLGDCPRELGGLAVWPGSRQRGIIAHGVRARRRRARHPHRPDSRRHLVVHRLPHG